MRKILAVFGCIVVPAVLGCVLPIRASQPSPEITAVILESPSEADTAAEEIPENADAFTNEPAERTDGSADSDEDVWKDAPDSGKGVGSSDDSLWDEGGDSPAEVETNQGAVDFTGLLRNKFAADLKEDNDNEDELHNHSEIQLGAKYVPSDRFHVLLTMDADFFAYGNDGDWDYDDTIRLHNAYLNWSGPGFNIKAGNQIVRWGKTDGYSPLDNLNPEDYREGIAGRREDRKLPIPMLNFEWYHGKSTLQGIYIPVFVSPELDRVGTDWAFFQHADQFLGALNVHEDDPSFSLRNSEVGIRLAGIIKQFDYAFSWFCTREDLPSPDSFEVPANFPVPFGDDSMRNLLMFSRLTGQPIDLKHDRQNIYGFEFETILGDFGLRGDFAYFDNSSYFTQALRRVRKPLFQYMAGIDYNGAGALYANFQLVQSYILNYDDRITGTEEIVTAVTGTLSKEFSNGDMKPECRFYVDVAGNAAMLNPKLILSYLEPVIIEIGAEVFDGSNGTIFETIGGNDLAYLVVEYSF